MMYKKLIKPLISREGKKYLIFWDNKREVFITEKLGGVWIDKDFECTGIIANTEDEAVFLAKEYINGC